MGTSTRWKTNADRARDLEEDTRRLRERFRTGRCYIARTPFGDRLFRVEKILGGLVHVLMYFPSELSFARSAITVRSEDYSLITEIDPDEFARLEKIHNDCQHLMEVIGKRIIEKANGS